MRLTNMCGHKDVECMQKIKKKSGVYLPKSIEAPEWASRASERDGRMDEEKMLKLGTWSMCSRLDGCVCVWCHFFHFQSFPLLSFATHTHTSAKAKRNIHATHTHFSTPWRYTERGPCVSVYSVSCFTREQRSAAAHRGTRTHRSLPRTKLVSKWQIRIST